MLNITENEAKILIAMYTEGADAVCASINDPDHVKDDNMTWCNQDDLLQLTDVSPRSLGGILASLSNKGLAVDSGETTNGARRGSDWYLTDKGIDAAYEAIQAWAKSLKQGE